MRPLRILAVLFLSITSALADGGVSFVTVSNWQEALDLAKKHGKPIFLDAYTDWCGWCKVMDKETFSNAEVAKVMNAAFVNVKMEMETGEGVDVAMKYRIAGFPTFMVFDAKGNPTYKTFGYQAPEDWLTTLKSMTNPDSAMSFKGMAPGIQLPWPVWHRKAFLKSKLRTRPSLETVSEWFNTQDDKLSEVAFGILMRHALPREIEDWVLQREQEYRERFGDDASGLREGMINTALSGAIKKKDGKLLQRAKDLEQTTDPVAREIKHLGMDGVFYQNTEQWSELGGVVQRFAARPDAATHAGRINEYCWSIYEKSDDAKAIAAALTAMQIIATRADATWEYIDTYASLLYKAGRYDDALREAERAVREAERVEADFSGTVELIEKIKAAK
ncbi:MAG: DUF255 domain-containing protein [Candidatus Kapabacteria bacterium]|nr:DUF255 domain-containing protein [Candidatus Kapabacteria bacterium]